MSSQLKIKSKRKILILDHTFWFTQIHVEYLRIWWKKGPYKGNYRTVTGPKLKCMCTKIFYLRSCSKSFFIGPLTSVWQKCSTERITNSFIEFLTKFLPTFICQPFNRYGNFGYEYFQGYIFCKMIWRPVSETFGDYILKWSQISK